MRQRHIVLAFGLAGSLALLAFGDNDPAPAPSAAARTERRSPPAARAAPGHEPWVMRVLPRGDLAGDGDADGDGAFRSQSWNPPARQEEEPVSEAPPPPSAPPLPFRFIGKALGASGWEVYLAEGEAVHVARPDAVIGGVYRVTEIAPPTMRLLYLPLGEVQGIDIGAAE